MKRSAKEDTEDIHGKKSPSAHKASDEPVKDSGFKASFKDTDNLPEVEDQPDEESKEQADIKMNEAARAVDVCAVLVTDAPGDDVDDGQAQVLVHAPPGRVPFR